MFICKRKVHGVRELVKQEKEVKNKQPMRSSERHTEYFFFPRGLSIVWLLGM